MTQKKKQPAKKEVVRSAADIRKRRRVAPLRSDNEATLRSLLNIGGAGVISTDLEGNITFINKTLCQITGYSREETLGKPFSGFLYPDDLPVILEKFLNGVAGARNYLTLEFRLIHKDGQIRWLLTSPTPIISGVNTIGFNAIIQDITRLKLMEEALRKSEDQYRLLAEHTTDIVWLMDMDLNVTYQSPSGEKLRGFTFREIKELPLEKNFAPESLKLALEVFTEELPKINADPGYNPVTALELEYYRKDGTTFWLENKFSVIRDDNGKPVYIQGEGRDITERRKVIEALRESEEKFRMIAELSTDVIYVTDSQGLIVYLSPSAESVFGYDLEEMVERNFMEFLSPDSVDIALAAFSRAISIGNRVKDLELYIKRKDGTLIIIDLNSEVLKMGEFIGTTGIIRDITQRKQVEQQIKHEATHDSLTGLPNRTLFYDRLSLAIAQANRRKNELAVLMLDLDLFKNINDALGHSVGDEVLKAVAAQLNVIVRTSDTVARMGGDEFVILLADVSGVHKAVEVAQRILEDLRNPLVIGGHELSITTSIGIAIYPQDGKDREDLLKKADIAMYAAKRDGRDRYCLCSYSVDKESPTLL